MYLLGLAEINRLGLTRGNADLTHFVIQVEALFRINIIAGRHCLGIILVQILGKRQSFIELI